MTAGYSDDALIHVISDNVDVEFAPPANGVLTVRQKTGSGGSGARKLYASTVSGNIGVDFAG